MHQEAYPGEDISDRPPPEESVPGLRALVDGDLPSGRYRATAPGGDGDPASGRRPGLGPWPGTTAKAVVPAA